MTFGGFIDNVIEHRQGEAFAAILGATPSKGARSPKLWNAAFAALGKPSVMLPLDVTAANLVALLDALDADADFIGGAVAVPHKETIAAWLGERLTPEAARIGAVNCLFRKNGRLWGTNTDGEAARVSLERKVGNLTGKRVVLLGPGGAGKAVAAYLAAAGANLTLAGRDLAKVSAYAGRIGAAVVDWAGIGAVLATADVVVNCTSLGSAAANMADASPLDAAQLARLPAGALVYDIIYDPSPTKLLALASERGLSTLDGAEMNLEQAIIAFGHAVPGVAAPDLVRSAMQGAR